MQRTRNTTYLSALLAFFMVVVLPACWAGALIAQRSIPGSSVNANLNEEERHEDGEEETEVRDLAGRRPPPPAPSERPLVHVTRLHVVATTSTIVASVADLPEPSVLSVRRLI